MWGGSFDRNSLNTLMQSNQIFAQQGSNVIKKKTKIRYSNGAHHSPAYLQQRRPPTNKACSSVMPYLNRYQLLGGYMSWVGPGCINKGLTLSVLRAIAKLKAAPQLTSAAAAAGPVWLRYSNKGADTVPISQSKLKVLEKTNYSCTCCNRQDASVYFQCCLRHWSAH